MTTLQGLLLPLFLLLHLLLAVADDSAVMLKLLSSLSPPPPGWSSSTDFCTWKNVHCAFGSVVIINLDSASVSGSLPPDLIQLSQLQTLSLKKNYLTGPLLSFANMTSLESISLDRNAFTSIPDNFLFGLTNLRHFSISKNAYLTEWQIPSYLTQSANLVTLYASKAGLTGTIPDIFGSFPNLMELRLSSNDLTGSLPQSFSGSNIQILSLSMQKQGLSGKIDVLANMTMLSQVWLYGNAFTGAIPDLSKCRMLFDLQLRDNMLTGVIPPSLMNLPKLANITLQNNLLQGPYPAFPDTVKVSLGSQNFCSNSPKSRCDQQVMKLLEVAGALGYPIVFGESWRGNNACQGWRLIHCDLYENVTVINFGKQGFSGSISPAFANLLHLRTLNMNGNNLTGVIPSVLTTLPNLEIFDISDNNLSGPIPEFPSRVNFVYSGNPLLGHTSTGDTPSSLRGSDKPRSLRGSGTAAKTAGVTVAVVVVFVGVTSFVSYKCYIRRRLRKSGRVEGSKLSNNSVNPNRRPDEHLAISMQVLRQATGDFSEENVLGKGGSGVVYKGEFHCGTKIAVKRIQVIATSTRGMKEFQAEIDVLTQVRHRHLVALFGYCTHGNERLLVYEYAPQGTLWQHLFTWQEHGYQPLTWKQRVTIALDVARGVEYLHSLAQQSFIHRDLKTSNILLADNMRAKVTDFGLVRNLPDGKQSVRTQLAGTFGYLPPEYGGTGRVTTKVDVYAFGVVLMELITGKKALVEIEPNEVSDLVTWFRRALTNNDNLRSFIDPLVPDPDEETYDSICKVAELAHHCTARQPFQRPEMRQVVSMLGPLVEQWDPHSPIANDLHMSLSPGEESTSTTFDDLFYSETTLRIPSKQPSGLANTY